MAKKKGKIKEVVETVESWVGMGPKAKKPPSTKAAKKTSSKPAKKGKTPAKKRTKKTSR
jgi:hypothetical protein